MSRFYDIVNLDSLIQTLQMYQFLTPALWFEHITYHAIMDNGYRFLKKYIGGISFEHARFLYALEDKGKTLIWSIKRLKNSSCNCKVCLT